MTIVNAIRETKDTNTEDTEDTKDTKNAIRFRSEIPVQMNLGLAGRRTMMSLRDAIGGLRSGRGTTVLAFVLLTAGMAASTVTFSVVDNVALRPLPVLLPRTTREYRRHCGTVWCAAAAIAAGLLHRA